MENIIERGICVNLSVLILTVPKRVPTFFSKLVQCLENQTKDRKDVEVLGLYDNKKRTVGEKRNILLNVAKGKFIAFVDDDDRVSPDYISSITEAIINNPEADCIVFDCLCTIIKNGKVTVKRHCKYGIEFTSFGITTPDGRNWAGKPVHTMAYSSKIAKQIPFPARNFKEDFEWSNKACLEIKNQIRINKILYYYDYNTATTETK